MYSYNIKVVDRILDIMDFIAVSNEESGLAEITQALKLPKSTVHRLLMVLERHQLVERNPGSEKYRLGLKLFELQSRAISKIDVALLSRPFLEQLVAKTGETAHLGILREGEVVSLCNVQSPHTLRPSTVGRRIPAYCTSLGKVMLAGLSEDELQAYLTSHRFAARTANTICSASRLKAEVRKIGMRGYGIDNEEFEKGLKCIGAPVRDHTGRIIAAVSVAGPISRVGRERTKTMRKAVITAAMALSRALGYCGPRAARVRKFTVSTPFLPSYRKISQENSQRCPTLRTIPAQRKLRRHLPFFVSVLCAINGGFILGDGISSPAQ